MLFADEQATSMTWFMCKVSGEACSLPTACQGSRSGMAATGSTLMAANVAMLVQIHKYPTVCASTAGMPPVHVALFALWPRRATLCPAECLPR